MQAGAFAGRLEDVLNADLNSPWIVRLIGLDDLTERSGSRRRYHAVSCNSGGGRAAELRGVQRAGREVCY